MLNSSAHDRERRLKLFKDKCDKPGFATTLLAKRLDAAKKANTPRLDHANPMHTLEEQHTLGATLDPTPC